MKDSQRSKVYHWENFFPEGKHIPYDYIKAEVDKVWSGMGLLYPPLIKPVPKNATNFLADATRYTLRFPVDGISYRILLHEVAHAMVASIGEECHKHDKVFVGMYMTLMEKFMGFDPNMLHHSAELANVKFTKNEKPRIVD